MDIEMESLKKKEFEFKWNVQIVLAITKQSFIFLQNFF